jgi:predicted GNAT superfamily acetyltransferase
LVTVGEGSGSTSYTADDLCDLGPADYAGVLALNNANAQETSVLNETTLAAIMDLAFYARGVEGGATAFLIALDHAAAYNNENFAWLKTARDSFVYVDRVIVAESARGRGIARMLYEDLFAKARAAGHVRVVCEVNVEPPNAASVAFHEALGFVPIGEATIHGGTKRVRYFEKLLC